MLSRFWPIRGWGKVSVNIYIKKGKFMMKIFFSIRLNEVLKICEKMIPADVRANKSNNK